MCHSYISCVSQVIQLTAVWPCKDAGEYRRCAQLSGIDRLFLVHYSNTLIYRLL